jgi:DNA-binding transcriptional ArsR family regulator
MVDLLTQISKIQEFPTELVKALEGLNHINRQKILITLLEGKQLSFSDIKHRTDMNDALLSSHLRKLKDSLLVEQYYQHIQNKQDYSYYQLTEYGKNILTKLLTK